MSSALLPSHLSPSLVLPPFFSLSLLLSPTSSPLRGYLVAAPSVFRAGVEESVSITIFNAKAETRVQVQLSVKGQAVVHSHGSVLDKGTVKLKVPSGLRGQAHLKVWGNRHLTEGGYIFHNYTTVTVESKGTAVFIQTDKPVYKPKHKGSLIVHLVVNQLIADPRGSRMVQWKGLKSVCCGVVNMSFPLSDQPMFGDWFIFVEVQGHTYNKSFEVQKYVMPKFELVIDPPHYIRDLNSCEQATVRARYTFGKPVTGKLTVNMTVNGVGYYRHEMGHPVIKNMEIKGSANFSLCVKDMMPLDVADHFRGTVSIWASVTSIDGSRQTTFDDSTPVHKQLIDIKYSKDTRKQFKPGLPYKGKIEVTYPDGSPADGVRVRVKAELTPKDNVYTSELISKDGQATFEIPSIPTAAQYVWLEVFKELADFDVSDAFGIPKDDGHFWWPGLSSKRRRRSSVFPWHWDITKDARIRTGCDDRYGEFKPPAERRHVHRRGCSCLSATHLHLSGCHALSPHKQVKDLLQRYFPSRKFTSISEAVSASQLTTIRCLKIQILSCSSPKR
uniref:C3 and PZP like alpha-2-macroglobulin domain containing 8 n=1 Tax=Seriola dumerili TaxID=41447 RepID=A0A3B4U0S2_SERDU